MCACVCVRVRVCVNAHTEQHQKNIHERTHPQHTRCHSQTNIQPQSQPQPHLHPHTLSPTHWSARAVIFVRISYRECTYMDARRHRHPDVSVALGSVARKEIQRVDLQTHTPHTCRLSHAIPVTMWVTSLPNRLRYQADTHVHTCKHLQKQCRGPTVRIADVAGLVAGDFALAGKLKLKRVAEQCHVCHAPAV